MAVGPRSFEWPRLRAVSAIRVPARSINALFLLATCVASLGGLADAHAARNRNAKRQTTKPLPLQQQGASISNRIEELHRNLSNASTRRRSNAQGSLAVLPVSWGQSSSACVIDIEMGKGRKKTTSRTAITMHLVESKSGQNTDVSFRFFFAQPPAYDRFLPLVSPADLDRIIETFMVEKNFIVGAPNFTAENYLSQLQTILIPAINPDDFIIPRQQWQVISGLTKVYRNMLGKGTSAGCDIEINRLAGSNFRREGMPSAIAGIPGWQFVLADQANSQNYEIRLVDDARQPETMWLRFLDASQSARGPSTPLWAAEFPDIPYIMADIVRLVAQQPLPDQLEERLSAIPSPATVATDTAERKWAEIEAASTLDTLKAIAGNTSTVVGKQNPKSHDERWRIQATSRVGQTVADTVLAIQRVDGEQPLQLFVQREAPRQGFFEVTSEEGKSQWRFALARTLSVDELARFHDRYPEMQIFAGGIELTPMIELQARGYDPMADIHAVRSASLTASLQQRASDLLSVASGDDQHVDISVGQRPVTYDSGRQEAPGHFIRVLTSESGQKSARTLETVFLADGPGDGILVMGEERNAQIVADNATIVQVLDALALHLPINPIIQEFIGRFFSDEQLNADRRNAIAERQEDERQRIEGRLALLSDGAPEAKRVPVADEYEAVQLWIDDQHAAAVELRLYPEDGEQDRRLWIRQAETTRTPYVSLDDELMIAQLGVVLDRTLTIEDIDELNKRYALGIAPEVSALPLVRQRATAMGEQLADAERVVATVDAHRLSERDLAAGRGELRIRLIAVGQDSRPVVVRLRQGSNRYEMYVTDERYGEQFIDVDDVTQQRIHAILRDALAGQHLSEPALSMLPADVAQPMREDLSRSQMTERPTIHRDAQIARLQQRVGRLADAPEVRVELATSGDPEHPTLWLMIGSGEQGHDDLIVARFDRQAEGNSSRVNWQLVDPRGARWRRYRSAVETRLAAREGADLQQAELDARVRLSLFELSSEQADIREALSQIIVDALAQRAHDEREEHLPDDIYLAIEEQREQRMAAVMAIPVVATLRQQLDELSLRYDQLSATHDQLQVTHAQTMGQLTNVSGELTALQEQGAQIEKQQVLRGRQLRTATQRYQAAEAELDEANTRVQELEDQVATHQKEAERLRLEAEEASKTHEAKTSALDEKVAEAEQRAATAAEELAALRKQLEEEQAVVQQLRAELEHAQSELTEAKEQAQQAAEQTAVSAELQQLLEGVASDRIARYLKRDESPHVDLISPVDQEQDSLGRIVTISRGTQTMRIQAADEQLAVDYSGGVGMYLPVTEQAQQQKLRILILAGLYNAYQGVSNAIVDLIADLEPHTGTLFDESMHESAIRMIPQQESPSAASTDTGDPGQDRFSDYERYEDWVDTDDGSRRRGRQRGGSRSRRDDSTDRGGGRDNRHR